MSLNSHWWPRLAKYDLGTSVFVCRYIFLNYSTQVSTPRPLSQSQGNKNIAVIASHSQCYSRNQTEESSILNAVVIYALRGWWPFDSFERQSCSYLHLYVNCYIRHNTIFQKCNMQIKSHFFSCKNVNFRPLFYIYISNRSCSMPNVLLHLQGPFSNVKGEIVPWNDITLNPHN